MSAIDTVPPVPVDAGTGGTPPLKVVPVRRPGRIVAAVVLLVVVAQIAQGMARSKNFRWHIFSSYFFAQPVLHGIVTTIELTVLAMAIGIGGGILVALGRVSTNPVVSAITWFYVYVFRGTPILVQLVVWFNISALFPRLGFGIPFGGPQFFSGSGNDITVFVAALLGLGLNEAAYMSEIVRAGLISVDEGQTEAAAALGMRRGQVLRRIVLPQAMRVIIPPTGNETISMLKTSSLASVITATELFQSVGNIYSQNFQVIPLLMVAVVWYLIMTSVLTTGQFYLERRFARGSSRTLPQTPIQRLRSIVDFRRPPSTTALLSVGSEHSR